MRVTLNGIVKGLYGKDRMPMITLKVLIDKASAKYARLPYGIDEFKADFFGLDATVVRVAYALLTCFTAFPSAILEHCPLWSPERQGEESHQ